MTNEEFSNAFDTLLNAYKHKSEFGDQSSIADVTIDEYEKSIFLTQAQDNIVKNYFTRSLSPNGEGFDDSTRRQMDFSTLITIKEINNFTSGGGFSPSGYTISFKDEDFKVGEVPAYPLFIINERIVAETGISTSYTAMNSTEKSAITTGSKYYTSTGTEKIATESDVTAIAAGTITPYKKVTTSSNGSSKSYVVVPLNYKEYDRMMSRAYCEPLKRQAWRLFEANSSTLDRQAEIILRSDAATPTKYVVRYVRRPTPIVLVDLSNTDNSLTIDGVTDVTQCELNPIVHQEILQEAVRLALSSNGIETRDMKALREASQQR